MEMVPELASRRAGIPSLMYPVTWWHGESFLALGRLRQAEKEIAAGGKFQHPNVRR